MKNVQKPRLTIDTNVWLSGIVFGGKPQLLIKLFVEEVILVVISEELLSELRRIVTQKFPLFLPKLALLEESLRHDAELVKLGSQTVTVSRDPDDNKVIETALIGNCQYIISGDKDLLDIGLYKNIEIVKPAAFLQYIKKSPI